MTKTIAALIPDPDDLLALEPEELAGVLLEVLIDSETPMHRRHLYEHIAHWGDEKYAVADSSAIAQAIVEAWSWLEHECLIIRSYNLDGDEGYFNLSRRAQHMQGAKDLSVYRQAKALPTHAIHESIRGKVRAAFLRGDHDVAVFQAFKEVEVAVRDAGGFSTTDIGTDLMRKAFKSGDGPLTDTSAPSAEQEALAHLFAGAIGSYKNPSSHRHIGDLEPQEAAEMIILASHLLRIVDARAKKATL